MDKHKKFDAISATYFTKGRGGVFQGWGNPFETPLNFKPQLPIPNVPGTNLVEVNGIGMGFAIFRTKMFKDKKLRRPWFKTVASVAEGTGSQDLFFWGDAKRHGYRCAVTLDVRSGHYDHEGKFGEPRKVY